MMRKLEIGQLWYDKDRIWSNGDVDMVYLILSADMEDGEYYWRVAKFMWAADGYCGAPTEKYLEKETTEVWQPGCKKTFRA